METSTHMSWVVVFAVIMVSVTVMFQPTQAMPTISAEDKRAVDFASQDTMRNRNMDILGRLLFLTQKYRHHMSAIGDQKFKRQEDIIPCLWNAVACYKKRK